MSLSSLEAGELISVLTGMLAGGEDGGREVLEGEPKLAAWIPDLEEHLEWLKNSSRDAATPQRQIPPGEGRRRDRRAESAVRVLHGMIDMADELELAEGTQPAEGQMSWRQVKDFIFDHGLSFLGASYMSQVGQTERVIQRARDPRVAERINALKYQGRTAQEILALLTTTNDALRQYASLQSNPRVTPSEFSVYEARRRAASLLRDFLPVVARALPEDAPSDQQARTRILGALEQAIARQARHQEDPPVQPGQPPTPEPEAPQP